MVYYHRKPPMYDETLNNNSVFFLKWGGFFYAAIAYWMIANRQMFNNFLISKDYQDQIEDYGHYFSTPDDYTFQSILKWLAIILGVTLLIYDAYAIFVSLFIDSPKKDIENHENLLEYPHCLPNKFLINEILEENIIRKKFGYKKMFDSTYDDLQKARISRENDEKSILKINEDKIIVDATSFDLLKQPMYYEKLNYVIPFDRVRIVKDEGKSRIIPKYNRYETSDFTRKVIDYPYVEGMVSIDEYLNYEL